MQGLLLGDKIVGQRLQVEEIIYYISGTRSSHVTTCSMIMYVRAHMLTLRAYMTVCIQPWLSGFPTEVTAMYNSNVELMWFFSDLN